MLENVTYHAIKCGRVNVSDVIEQVTVGAQLADNHDRSVASVDRDTDAKLMKECLSFDSLSKVERVDLRSERYWDDQSHPIISTP